MAYEVREIKPKPAFTVHVADSAGRPARLSVYTGEAVIEQIPAEDWNDERAHQVAGFLVPDAEPVPEPGDGAGFGDGDGAGKPTVSAEAHLCGAVIDTRTQQRVAYGVADVSAGYEDGGLYIGFRCFAHPAIRVGYRVSVLWPAGD